jgi:hypothetical protein
MDGFERMVERVVHQSASRSDFPDGGTASQPGGELEPTLDNPARALEIDQSDCLICISRGNARYHKMDPECEADYRAAFLLDAPLAAREIVRRLEGDIRDDLAHVLLTCRNRVCNDPQDVVARARLGLTLLLLYQDETALYYLQQVFGQSPAWRPFLRLLVNEAKWWRATRPSRLSANP